MSNKKNKNILNNKGSAAVSLLIICVMLVSFFVTGCAASNSDIPDGMQLASTDGAEFCLYVPTSWMLNTESGMSGAYYSISQKTVVYANAYTDVDCETVEQFWGKTAARYDAEYKNFKNDVEGGSGDAATLGDKNAKKYVFEATIDGDEYKIAQYIAQNEGKFFVFTYSAEKENYEQHLTTVEAMAKVFSFKKNEKAPTPDRTDSAPESMKIASSDKVEYVLYVPQKWIVDNSVTAGAYYSDTDRSNVNVVSYYGEEMTVTDYWDMCEAEYKAQFSNYSLHESYKSKLGSRNTYVYIFTLSFDGKDYRMLQAISAYGELMYTFTYTADESLFDSHIDDVKLMMEQFKFR